MDRTTYDATRAVMLGLIEEKHVLALRLEELTKSIEALQHALDKADKEGIADV